MSITVKAYYNGAAFVPVKSLDIQKGKVFTLSILQGRKAVRSVAKKVMAFECITNNLRRINAIEPLSSEFDAMLSQRIYLKEKIDL